MFIRLASALLRAVFVMILIVFPSILLPGLTADTAFIVVLIALFAAGLVIFEYASSYPSLIEFRDAPPFNRIRFISLFVTILMLTLICRGIYQPTALTILLTDIGHYIGKVMDFPFSPVRLIISTLPDDSSAEKIELLRMTAGVSYMLSVMSLVYFMLFLALRAWPTRSVFNVWVNLPTFDPTAGGDVVKRLNRDALVNVFLGFVLPFVIPIAIGAAAQLFTAISLDNDQTMIWMVTAWAFLPASLFMRGLAMGRVAKMIQKKRKRSYSQDGEDGLLFV
ncbi:hypothetical protein [Parasulfitobacter algicola]